MSVGWLKVRRTDYETRRLTKLLRNKNFATCVIHYFGISAYPGVLILSQKIIRLKEHPIELQYWTEFCFTFALVTARFWP